MKKVLNTQNIERMKETRKNKDRIVLLNEVEQSKSKDNEVIGEVGY